MNVRLAPALAAGVALLIVAIVPKAQAQGSTAPAAQYDISTLAGKVAALRDTGPAGLRFSATLERAANVPTTTFAPATPITPAFVLASPLDGTSVLQPAVTVNQDTAGGPQNETVVAVDPNNPSRLVAAANDYVTRTWACTVDGTACSALFDAASGTYYSNDSGQTWCCASSDPDHQGTLIPGVQHVSGGPYDAGGDPSLAFDSRGSVYFGGAGFDRAAPPNTVAVNKGTFDASGTLMWQPPTFIGATTAPSIINDKPWIAADWHVESPYRDRVYVSFTRFVFNPRNGAFVQSPIFFAYSTDGGRSFSEPQSIVGNVHDDQGSRPLVAYDGSVYVVFLGKPDARKPGLHSIYVVKSIDGGATFDQPVKIADVRQFGLENADIATNSFPAGDVAPNGDVYVTWGASLSDNSGEVCPAFTNDGCHSAALYSRSSDGGSSWSAPMLVFPTLDAANQTAVGYPMMQPGGATLDAPSPRRVDMIWPSVAVSPSGVVYMSTYAVDLVSPWQTCATAPPDPVGRIACDELGDYIHNARLDYFVTNLASGNVYKASTHPINTRHGFNGTFLGDYVGLAVGSDNVFHAIWTDTNNRQTLTWFYGFDFVPTPINQQDVVTASGTIP